MAKRKGVSLKTHTKNQLDDYANQHNPNNKAFKANQQNKNNQKKKARLAEFETGATEPLDWYCYGNPIDFD